MVAKVHSPAGSVTASSENGVSGDQCSIGVFSSRIFTEQEARNYEYFRLEIAPKLCGFFGHESTFWTRLVLQSAISEPAVRHIVCALGSLQNHLVNLSTLVTHSYPSFPIKQYGIALKHLLQPIHNDRAQPIILISCILSIFYEILFGNYNAAVTHVRSGLKLLFDGTSRSKGQVTLSDQGLQSSLERMFHRYGRHLIELNLPLSKEGSTITVGDFHCPSCFESLEQATEVLETFFNGVIRTLHPMINQYTIGSYAIPEIPHEQKQLLTWRLRRWETSFDHFLQSVGTDLIGEGKIHPTVSLLRMYAKLVYLMLYLDRSRGEMAYDHFPNEAKEIVDHGTNVYMQEDAQQRKPLFRITALNPLLPLYTVTHRCRDPFTRRKALRLLQNWNCIDGLWNSQLTSQVCGRIVSLEEAKARDILRSQGVGLEETFHLTRSDQIPEAARLMHVRPQVGEGRLLRMDYINCIDTSWTPEPAYFAAAMEAESRDPKILRETILEAENVQD